MGHGLAAVALVAGAVEPRACHRDGVLAVKVECRVMALASSAAAQVMSLNTLPASYNTHRLVAPLGLLKQL